MSKLEIDKNENRHWYNEEGKIHRENGPAYEASNGYKAWYKNGQLHREGGPAIIMVSGTKQWYKNGKRHRIDGPAVTMLDGTKLYFLDGIMEWKYKRKNEIRD